MLIIGRWNATAEPLQPTPYTTTDPEIQGFFTTRRNYPSAPTLRSPTTARLSRPTPGCSLPQPPARQRSPRSRARWRGRATALRDRRTWRSRQARHQSTLPRRPIARPMDGSVATSRRWQGADLVEALRWHLTDLACILVARLTVLDPADAGSSGAVAVATQVSTACT